MPRKIGELFFELRTQTTALQGDLKDAERQFGKFADFVKANPLASVTGLGAAFAGLAFAAAQAAGKIDLTFRQVTNILGATGKEAAQLRDDLRAVSLESGRSAEEIAGLFRAIAEGGPNGAANVKAIADAAIALSDVLGGDVNANASGLDLITDVFAIDPSRAREVAAVINNIASGRVPLNDVFDALSKIGPEAAALGLSFETVAAFLTRFLDQGYSVKRVSSLFKDLAEQGTEGRDRIIELAGASGNLTEALDKLATAQANVDASVAKQSEKVRNELRNAWLEFGTALQGPVANALTFVNGFLAGTGSAIDRTIFGLAKVGALRAQLSGEGLLYKDFVLTNNDRDGAPTALGQRFAAIVSATKNLEKLSISVLRENQKKLADIIDAAGGNDSIRTKAEELQKKIGDAIKAAAETNQRDTEKSFEKLKATLANLASDVDRILGQAFDEVERTRDEAVKSIDEDSSAQNRKNKQLADQVTALLKSKQAYDDLLIVQAQDNAELALRQQYQKAGIPITEKELQQIRERREATAEQIRLDRIRNGLTGGTGTPPVKPMQEAADAAGQYAEALSMAAGAAAGIATAFGESGRRMASLLGSTSQLLTALSRAQSSGLRTITDAAGNSVQENVGFFGALSGKAGASASAQAAASALAFTAAAVQIANALDLFGSRASQQAAELREKAIQFNKALESFAISQRTDLEEQLRQNIESANKIANDTVRAKNVTLGGEFAFTSSREIATFIEGLKQTAAQSARNKRALEPFIAELEKLLKTTTDNEAKLKVLNDAVLTRLREDLEVRKLIAQGRSAEADERRAQLEVDREEAELRRRFGEAADEYIRDLRIVAAAEAAVRAETARRARIQQQLQDDNALLGGNATDRLRRSVKAFGDTFFTGFFDEFDLSSRAGLEGAKGKLRDFYRTLAADGISEAERPVVEAIKAVIGDIDAAIGALPETLDPIATAMEAFNARVELFGLSIPERFKGLAKIFTGSFGDWFDGVLANADLTTAEGRDSLKRILNDQLSAILSDGVISEGERALYNFLVMALGIVNEAIDEATREAEQIAADAAATRGRRRSFAQNVIDLFDLEGADALKITIGGFGDAFSKLFGTFDLTTLAGIEQAKNVVRGLFVELQNLSDEQILAKFGMTREELIAALLATDSGLDTLVGSLNSVEQAAVEAANAAKSFADQVSEDYLRASGNDRAADEAAAQRKRDDRLKELAGLTGLTEEQRARLAQQIESIYRADLRRIADQYTVKAAETVQTAVSTTAARGTAAEAAARPRTRNTTLVQDFGGLSEVTGETLAGIQREALIYAAETANATAGMYRILSGGLPVPPTGLLRFAGGDVAAGSTTGPGGLVIGSITVNIGALSPAGMTPDQAARSTVDQIIRELGVRARREVKFLGDARL